MRLLPYPLVITATLCASAMAFEDEVRPILKQSCVKCHGGEKVKGKVDFFKILTEQDADAQFELWETVVEVIESGEMPPDDEPRLGDPEEKTLVDWYQKRSQASIEAKPAVFKPRRLSGPEYRNTLRSLFGFDLEVAVVEAEQTVISEQSLVLKLLPTDPPGASGFINDTHQAPLSPLIWDQYLHLSHSALEKLFSKKGKTQLGEFLGAPLPNDWVPKDLSPDQAEKLIRAFLPRALRRPVPQEQLAKILSGISGKRGHPLLAATKLELKAVLMSPAFFYRGLLMEGDLGKQQEVDQFELAERLSYFLWEDRPDEKLTRLAIEGSLGDEQILNAQVARMLSSSKARNLAQSFGVQWLKIDSLDGLVGKDPIRHHALKSQPIDFLNYLFTENRPIMELIDSKITFVNQGTSGFYGKDRQRMNRPVKPKGIERQRTPNHKLELVHAEGRGGLLTMPGILTMNQGPIQRGTWMLRRILGVSISEPPADTPPIQGGPRGRNLTFRERFEAHRSDITCARCHEKIDPLGFALDGYDRNGRFLSATDRSKTKSKKTKEQDKAIDTSGKLPSGETFENFKELKAILLTRKREPIVRNIVETTLAYALCRKLERNDQPVVNAITRNLCENEGIWQSLFQQIANSLPFRENMEKFDYLLTKLKSYQDQNGSLLDHSIVLFGSGMGHSDNHTAQRIPIVLAGKGGGMIKTGRYLRYSKNQELGRLHLSLLQKFGIDSPTYANSSAPLPGLDGGAFEEYQERNFETWVKTGKGTITVQGRLRMSDNLDEAKVFYIDVTDKPPVKIEIGFRDFHDFNLAYHVGTPITLTGNTSERNGRLVLTKVTDLKSVFGKSKPGKANG